MAGWVAGCRWLAGCLVGLLNGWGLNMVAGAWLANAEAQEAVNDLFGGANTKTTAAGEMDDEVPAPSIINSFATATTQDNVLIIEGAAKS